MRPVQNEREVMFTGCHEPRVKERELLVEELRPCRGVVLEGHGRGREPLEDRFGRHLSDVVEHLAVLRLGVQLSWPDRQGHCARTVRTADRDVEAAYVLSWLEPPTGLRFVIEAEQLAGRLERDSLGAVDPKHVRSVLLDRDAIVIAFEIVRAVRQRADCQRAEDVTAVVSDCGIDGGHVTR